MTKIVPEELRAFAEGEAGQRRAVLIEVDAPPPRLVFPARTRQPGARRPVSIETDEDARTRTDDSVARTEAGLAELGIRAAFLPSACAFTAEVDAEELRRIAALPTVHRVTWDQDRKLRPSKPTSH